MRSKKGGFPGSQKEIDALIDQNRKQDFVVVIREKDGRTVADKGVSYKLKKHDFLWGVALGSQILDLKTPNPNRDKYLEIVKRNFNHGVHENAAKWYAMEPERGVYVDDEPIRIYEWCKQNGISMRGHCLLWSKDKFVQKWQFALSPKELREAILGRLHKALKLFKGMFTDWDLNNEIMHMDYYARVLRIKDSDYFKWAQEISPEEIYYVNEYDVLDGSFTKAYCQQIQKLLDDGAKVGGIGCQAHWMEGSVPSNEVVWNSLQQLGKFRLPIKITEVTVTGKTEKAQAENLRQFLSICFAHPQVELILMWGFWEGHHFHPPGGLWRKDWTPKPAARMLEQLIHKEWSTKGKSRTNSKGEIRFRGFPGEYEFSVGKQTISVQLTRKNYRQAIIIP